MRYIAGIDIGNSSTEVALARQDETGALTITHSALAETTGIKGTLRNVFGIQEALALVAKRAGINVSDISLIRINEATPVIGDVAMETITETIITESTMIGHCSGSQKARTRSKKDATPCCVAFYVNYWPECSDLGYG